MTYKPFQLENLRQSLPDDLVLRAYPSELWLHLRAVVSKNAGWEALALDHAQFPYGQYPARRETNVVFRHGFSGLVVVSPSIASAMNWRVYYVGDGCFFSPCYCEIARMLAIRYEVTAPEPLWARAVLASETPWLMRQPRRRDEAE